MRNSTQEAKNNKAVAEAQASLTKKVFDAHLLNATKWICLIKLSIPTPTP